jgi:hypothetical protein
MAPNVSRVEAGFALCKSAKQLVLNIGRYPADWIKGYARKVYWCLCSGCRREVPKAHRRFVDMLFPDSLCSDQSNVKISKTVKRVYSVCCLDQPLRARYACVQSAMLAADGLCRDGRTQGVLSGGKERAWKTRQLLRVCEWTNGSEIKINGKERGRSAGDLQS